ncbi:LAFE_0A02564g1_1 [Lachancea fermentati]|uniref:Signal peptidase complex subunit 2 n=1 Tax=Lachancea fermentati TaxID=4955 RepID=A0A1G4M6H3_LACFM|nr:LAFE_0A02564g1_1 [Lachancea fermentati]
MSKPINVYCSADLRQTLDEALPGVFSRLGYVQSFKLIDTKLIIGYSIAVVAGVSFYLDKILEYSESLTYQKILVGLYAALSGLFWYFNKYIEKNVKYTGINKSKSIQVAATLEQYTLDYKLKIRDNEGHVVETTLPANKVFTEQGYLQTDLLYKWFENQLNDLTKKRN